MGQFKRAEHWNKSVAFNFLNFLIFEGVKENGRCWIIWNIHKTDCVENLVNSIYKVNQGPESLSLRFAWLKKLALVSCKYPNNFLKCCPFCLQQKYGVCCQWASWFLFCHNIAKCTNAIRMTLQSAISFETGKKASEEVSASWRCHNLTIRSN